MKIVCLDLLTLLPSEMKCFVIEKLSLSQDDIDRESVIIEKIRSALRSQTQRGIE